MKKVLFPLYMKEDTDEYLFYRGVFEKEGFVFAQAEEESLLLRSDAVLLFADERIHEDGAKEEFLNTALERKIPVILVHASKMPSLRVGEGVLDAARISFAQLKQMISENQKDILRKEEPETKRSRFFSILVFVIIAFLGALLLFRAVSYTMERTEPAVSESGEVSRRVEEAVVNVYTSSVLSDENWRGCGFAVSEDGFIITNAHVVDKPGVKYHVVYRGKGYEAKVISISETEDIALLKINTLTRYTLPVAENLPEQNEPVYAVGYPGDQKLTVLKGNIAGEEIRFSKSQSYVPVAMSLEAGISGSPIIDAKGSAVGIASARSLETENLSYMVSCEKVREFAKNYLFVDR